MTFEKYVTDWFHTLVEEHEDNKEWCERLFSQLGYDVTHLDDNESPYDFLLAMIINYVVNILTIALVWCDVMMYLSIKNDNK